MSRCLASVMTLEAMKYENRLKSAKYEYINILINTISLEASHKNQIDLQYALVHNDF